MIENQKNEKEQDFTQDTYYQRSDDKLNDRQRSAFQSFD